MYYLGTIRFLKSSTFNIIIRQVLRFTSISMILLTSVQVKKNMASSVLLQSKFHNDITKNKWETAHSSSVFDFLRPRISKPQWHDTTKLLLLLTLKYFINYYNYTNSHLPQWPTHVDKYLLASLNYMANNKCAHSVCP